MQSIDSEEDLIQIVHKQKKVVIYGAGAVANHILDILPADGKFEILSILVTDREGNPESLRGLPLKTLDEIEIDKDTFILAAVGEKLQREITELLSVHEYHNIGVLGGRLCRVPVSFRDMEQKMKRLEDSIVRLTPQTRLKTLVVNILDHCNLNCWGCDHFAPIAEKRCIPAETVSGDVRQLAHIMGDSVDEILVMGGEPLLHPELSAILRAVRGSFPKSDILISTNGLLLLKMTEEFWKICREYRIGLNITKYPVPFDYGLAEKKASDESVAWKQYSGYEVVKTLYHIPLDPEGKQDARNSFLNCSHANNFCNMLTEGRLYTCTVAPCIAIFNKKYGLHLDLEEDDGLDIYSVRDKKEVFGYLSRPMPFCRYCNVKGRTFGHPWRQSEASISEWTCEGKKED